MSYIDFDGLFYYNDKIKKYIEKKIEESKTGESTSSIDNTEVSNHIKNNNIHVTSLEKDKWNNKLDRTDLTDYAKTADVNTNLSNKVDKIEGKGLSTNDYTTEEKTKVETNPETGLDEPITKVYNKVASIKKPKSVAVEEDF